MPPTLSVAKGRLPGQLINTGPDHSTTNLSLQMQPGCFPSHSALAGLIFVAGFVKYIPVIQGYEHVGGAAMKTLARLAALFSLTTLLFVPAFSQIIIVSQPQTVAAVGRLYTYQVQVQDPTAHAAGDTLKYSLATAPPGMTIDSIKGLVQWVPKSAGVASVGIVVSSRLSREVTQNYKLTVVGFFGTIAGTVRDTAGYGIPQIMVSLFSVNPPPIQPLVMPVWGTLSAVTDSVGRYTINPIDSGTYYAMATSLCNVLMAPIPCPFDDYITVYYKDSPTLAGATAIPVKDSNTVRIDFTMHKRGKPANVTISGTARDTAGKPIAGASVIVSPINKCPVVDDGTGGGIVVPSEPTTSIIGYPDAISVVRTDAQGNYAATVVAGGPYVVECIAQGYVIQFYKLKGNYLEADRLTVTKDTSGVNFILASLPKATARVSGVVHDSSGKGVASSVVLYSQGPSPLASVFAPINARTVRTDTLGNFVFENVPNGAYILQAIPLRGYLPAYYTKNECGEVLWKKADTILVKESDVSGLIVCVQKRMSMVQEA